MQRKPAIVEGFDYLILSDVTLCHIVTLSWLYSHG